MTPDLQPTTSRQRLVVGGSVTFRDAGGSTRLATILGEPSITAR